MPPAGFCSAPRMSTRWPRTPARRPRPPEGWRRDALRGLRVTSRRRRALRYAGIYAALALFLLIALFPLAWMTITAFKHERDLYSMKFPLWFNLPPTLKHFDLLFT